MHCEKYELTCNLTHVYAGYMVTALSLLCSNHLLFPEIQFPKNLVY